MFYRKPSLEQVGYSDSRATTRPCAQPVPLPPFTTRYRHPPSALRSLRFLLFKSLRHPTSALRHPTDSCAFCASLRPTLRLPPSVLRPPILALFAPLCGQSPSTRSPPIKSDQTPFQTHPHSAPAARSSLLKSLLYKAPFVPAHVAQVGRRKLDSGFGHKLRVIGPVDLACIGPAPNRRPAGMLARVRTHHFD